MRLENYQRTLVSDGAGAGSASVGPITGKLISIGYTKDGTTPYTDGVDFTIATLQTLQTLWAQVNVNATVQVAPRQATHSNAGVAAVYAGTDAVRDHYYLREDMINIVIAQAGAAKSGRFDIVVET